MSNSLDIAGQRCLNITSGTTSARRLLAMIVVACFAFATFVSLVTCAGAGAAERNASRAQVTDAQSRIAHAELVNALKDATAGSYGGVWFDSATAQLHVGVTSESGRQAAEGAIAQAALAGDVTITPVRSSAAELLSTQQRWNRKLAGLFAREQVTTALAPQRNQVSVRLSASVPASERVALQHEAATDPVNVDVTVVPGQRLGTLPQAKTTCKEWVTFKAYCDPSLTSGVTLLKEKKAECTAGPLAINSKKERFAFTAGHCIGKAKENWSAINTAEVESVVGPVEEFIFGAEGGKSGDFADILIQPAWQTGKPNRPVLAVTAQWGQMAKKAEKTSYPVKGKRIPTVGNESCHVGQTSGESCGEISAINLSVTIEKKAVEGFVEVKEPAKPKGQLIAEGGDSGGPWMFIEANNEALMEGIMHGVLTTPECVEVEKETEGRQFFKTQKECEELKNTEKATNKGKWQRKLVLVFYPLAKTEKEAPEGALEQLKLELLTTANESLVPAVEPLKGEPFPVAFKAASGETKIETVGKAAITCTADTALGEFETLTMGKAAFTLTGCKLEKVECRSENELGEKAPVETILATGLLNVLGLLNAKEELEAGLSIGLLAPVKIVCGAAKGEIRGSALGAFTPLNKEVLVGENAKLELKQKEGKQQSGECLAQKPICEKLAKEPLEANLTGKFEGAGEETTETIGPLKMIEIIP
jgi:hypothetical protein